MNKTLITGAALLLSIAAFASPAAAQTQLTVPVNGTIANDAAAQGGACQKVCAGVKWDGQWKTTTAGKMSVCGTAFGPVDAGPIWDQADAQKKCPVVTKMTFNGSWTNTPPAGTTYAGKGTAVCGCTGGKPFVR